MDILHMISSLSVSTGGPARSVSGLAGRLAERGHAVSILTGPKSGGESHVSLDDRVRLIHAKGLFGKSFALPSGYISRIYPDSQSAKPEIIHSHGLWLPVNVAADKLSKTLGIPHVINPRGMLEPWALNYHRHRKRLAMHLYQRKILDRADLLVATSDSEMDAIRFIGLNNPVAVIPNAVDFPDWRREPKAPDRVRTALFVSRIHIKKGVLNLIEAWSRLDHSGWQLKIVGPDDGGHLSEVLERISSLNLKEKVTYIGEVYGQQLEAEYKNADLFVLPTFSENFGLVIAEALSYGLPVITTNTTPWAGIAENKCGWWIDVGVQPLVKAFNEALSMSDSDRYRMGAAALDFVKPYGWGSTVDRVEESYKWLLGKAEKPDYIHVCGNSGRIHVINFIHNLHRRGGGVAKVAVDLSDWIVRRPEVKASICVAESSSDSISPDSESIEVFRSGLLFSNSVKSRYLRSECRVIHNHGIWLPINHHASGFAKKNRIPLICQPHGMLEPWALAKGRYKKKMALLAYQHGDLASADVLVATADSEYAAIRSIGLRNPVAVIPNGIDFSEFDFESPGVSSDDGSPKCVLFLSRIHPKKGLINLLHAWAKVRRPDWKLLLAGPNDDNHLSEVLSTIERLELSNSVEYLGEVYGQDKIDLYRKSSLFVLPTYSENFGLVVAEALACGVPAIVTKAAPWSELVDFECGWWIDIGVEPLAEALQNAMSLDDERLIQMAGNAMRYVKKYDWNSVSAQFVHLYKWVCGVEKTMPEFIRTD